MKNVYRATELIGNAYAKFIDGASPEVARWIIAMFRDYLKHKQLHAG